MQSSPYARTLLVLLLVTIYFCARGHHRPPRPEALDAPETCYSAERAFFHVRRIGAQPHPAGSAQAAEVRDYIIAEIEALGLAADIQETMVYRPPYTAATVQNILTRIPGQSERGNAVALMAHYDSVVFGPGAADNGAGVAALLEAMRALLAGPPFFNDIIFLFTDAEEGRLEGGTGLLGAHAFVEHHPWMKDVRVVVNLDARGVRGASYMYQTSGKNAWLISQLARSGARASATSFMFEIYDAMPVGSDLTAFINAGVPGYDCAFISGLQKYHTMLDAPEFVSLASLQHHGEYAFTLVRHLANQPLEDAARAAENVVYFDIFGHHLVYYGNTTALILTVLTLAAFMLLTAFGLRCGEITWPGLARIFCLYVLWTGLCAGVAALAMIIGYQMRGVYILYSSDELTLGLLLIFAGAGIWVLNRFMDRHGVYNTIVGLLLVWVLLLIVCTLFAPGATYLMTWPLLFTLIPVGVSLARREKLASLSPVLALLFAVAAIPTLLFMVAVMQGLYEALVFIFVPLHVCLLLLSMGILAPHLRLLTGGIYKSVTVCLTALGLVFLVVGVLWPGFSPEQPKFNSVTYGLNADTGEAFYMSCDDDIDDWTAQFFPPDTPKLPISEFLPIAERNYLKSAAPALPLEAPTLEVIGDDVENGQRRLRLRIDSPRGAEVINVYAEPGTTVLAGKINGLELEMADGAWRLCYSVYRGNGFELELLLAPGSPARFRIADHQYYPEQMLGYLPRPPQYVPKPNTVDFNRDPLKSEESIVVRTFDLSQGEA